MRKHGVFEELEPRWLLSGQGHLFVEHDELGGASVADVAVGDLDRDGDLDVLLGNSAFSPNTTMVNDGSGLFLETTENLGSGDTRRISLADLDGDGDFDAFIANAGPNEVWLNDGHGRFRDSGQRLGNVETIDLALGDIDGDGDLDALEARIHNADVDFWLNDGSGNFRQGNDPFGPLGPLVNEFFGAFVAPGDVDADGDLDVIVGRTTARTGIGYTARLWLNDGAGGLVDTHQQLADIGRNVVTVRLGDLDDDSDLDALVVHDSPNSSRIWLNDGAGNFVDSAQRVRLDGSDVAVLGDVDSDGDLDIIIGGRGPHNVVSELWINDGNAIFRDAGERLALAPAMSVADIELADVDGDGDLDILILNAYSGIALWANQTDVQAPVYEAGDTNFDGAFDQFDIIQVLQSSTYLASAPATWQEGDWNGDGVFNQFDIVAALQTGNYLQGSYRLISLMGVR